ncbi:MAG TPA: tetratricopeptide repeat protein [Pyrinomonadaceae bacterium]|nr:tetratricopeptide repeat protein [Pyrinomonadaceae bacterium]
MRINLFFRTAVAALLLSACAVVASAQSTPVSGKVTMRQADGSEVPVQDAIVDFYQTDISRKFLGLKTDKNGVYRHAGLPLGVYTIIVSAPGARSSFQTNVRISQTPEMGFRLEPGESKRLTLDDVKTILAGNKSGTSGGGGGGAAAATPAAAAAAADTKESKEEREKRLAETAKIEAENQKIVNSNEVVSRTFKAGNEARIAGIKASSEKNFSAAIPNFDEAIRQYEEGLAAREDTALLANRSDAYRQRGAARFNLSIKMANDDPAKAAAMEAAFNDWRKAAESANRAVELVKAQTASTDPAMQASQNQNKLAAYSTRAEAMRLIATKVDRAQADAAFTAFQEYIDLQTDPAKKAQMRTDAAKILFDANAYARAAEEYKKILAEDPENADAYLYLGFALFNTGEKANFQEAANFIGRFVEKAPETNSMKTEAKEILEFLKTQENIKPEKIQPAPTRRRRG